MPTKRRRAKVVNATTLCCYQIFGRIHSSPLQLSPNPPRSSQRMQPVRHRQQIISVLSYSQKTKVFNICHVHQHHNVQSIRSSTDTGVPNNLYFSYFKWWPNIVVTKKIMDQGAFLGKEKNKEIKKRQRLENNTWLVTYPFIISSISSFFSRSSLLSSLLLFSCILYNHIVRHSLR